MPYCDPEDHKAKQRQYYHARKYGDADSNELLAAENRSLKAQLGRCRAKLQEATRGNGLAEITAPDEIVVHESDAASVATAIEHAIADIVDARQTAFPEINTDHALDGLRRLVRDLKAAPLSKRVREGENRHV